MVDWKKEIKLSDFVARNKGDSPPAATVTTAEDAEPADKPSIWKRELRLRKPQEPAGSGPLANRPFAAPPRPELPEPDLVEQPEVRRSPLRREISFRRRRKEAGDLAAEATPNGHGARPSAARRGRKKTSIVGLKVGASQLAAAHVVANGHAELVQIAREPLERGVVVGGELRDPEALGAALKGFFARNKLPSRGVRLGVGTNRIGVRHFEISGLQSRDQLENAVRFRAQ